MSAPERHMHPVGLPDGGFGALLLMITEASIAADLRALAAGEHPGRTSGDEITLFKSAGFGAADLAAARLASG